MNPTNPLLRIRPPVISNLKIVAKAEAIAHAYIKASELPLDIMAISFEAAYEAVIYPEYGIVLEEGEDLGFDANGNKILGKYDPLENVAWIDRSLREESRDPRRAFTCWHEVGGHGILQGDWLRTQMKRLKERNCVITTESSLSQTTTDVLERQANLFASHAGAPTALLYVAIDQLLNLHRPIRYIGPGIYMLDVRGQLRKYGVESFNDLCRIIGSLIQHRFGYMSVEALSYRIEKLSVMRDETVPQIELHRKMPAVLGFTSSNVSSVFVTH